MRVLLPAVALAVGAAILAATWFPRERDHLIAKLPKIDRECPSDVLVVVVFGQSQAANSGELRKIGPPGAYFFHDGLCYHLRDPVLGASGRGGSVWPEFANRLGRDVMIINGAVNGASIQELAGAPLTRLRRQIDLAANAGYRPDLTIFMQGETNGAQRSSASSYLARLKELRAALPGPWLITLDSACYGLPAWQPLNAARRTLASQESEVALGPDLDRLGLRYRQADKCHFNALGQERAAEQLAFLAKKAI